MRRPPGRSKHAEPVGAAPLVQLRGTEGRRRPRAAGGRRTCSLNTAASRGEHAEVDPLGRPSAPPRPSRPGSAAACGGVASSATSSGSPPARRRHAGGQHHELERERRDVEWCADERAHGERDRRQRRRRAHAPSTARRAARRCTGDGHPDDPPPAARSLGSPRASAAAAPGVGDCGGSACQPASLCTASSSTACPRPGASSTDSAAVSPGASSRGLGLAAKYDAQRRAALIPNLERGVGAQRRSPDVGPTARRGRGRRRHARRAARRASRP